MKTKEFYDEKRTELENVSTTKELKDFLNRVPASYDELYHFTDFNALKVARVHQARVRLSSFRAYLATWRGLHLQNEGMSMFRWRRVRPCDHPDRRPCSTQDSCDRRAAENIF